MKRNHLMDDAQTKDMQGFICGMPVDKCMNLADATTIFKQNGIEPIVTINFVECSSNNRKLYKVMELREMLADVGEWSVLF